MGATCFSQQKSVPRCLFSQNTHCYIARRQKAGLVAGIEVPAASPPRLDTPTRIRQTSAYPPFAVFAKAFAHCPLFHGSAIPRLLVPDLALFNSFQLSSHQFLFPFSAHLNFCCLQAPVGMHSPISLSFV